jgi:predicted kinase
MVMVMSTPPSRSVKIGDDERGGWSSDRPRRPGSPERPPRKADVSVRGRVLAPTDRLRYSPGSLLVVVSADRTARDRFIARALEEQSALLSLDKVRTLLAGKVAADEVEAKAAALLDAAAGKRLAAGQTVVIAADGLDPEERERYVRLAAAHRRPRHLILLEVARDAVAEEDRAVLTELRTALDAGELGSEGFATSLRLGGRTIEELKRIVFAPPPSDD